MTERSLHPTPSFRRVVSAEVRAVALSLRPIAVVVGVIFAIVTLLISIEIVRGDAESWFDAAEWAPLMFLAFAFPFAVWRTDRRFGPAFLWTLPVERRRLAIAKVFAGWIWLMTVLAMLMVWHRILALLSGIAGARTIPLIAFSGITAAYLFGSALVLGLRHPLRCLLGCAGLLFFVGMLRQVTDPYTVIPLSLTTAWAVRFEKAFEHTSTLWQRLPVPGQWGIATIVSIAAGLAALWAALARHRERRRQ